VAAFGGLLWRTGARRRRRQAGAESLRPGRGW